jgi:PAS domain S-box-containing protein
MPRSNPITPEAISHAAIFRASPTATLVLDVELNIRDANPAYLRATGRELGELVGRNVFVAFPDNPEEPGEGVARLRASMQRALETGEPDGMWVQRYDIPGPRGSGSFEERYWSPVNTPILDVDGRRLGLLHTVEDVTAFRDELRRALAFYRAEAGSGAESPTELQRRFEDYAASTLTDTRLFSDLVTEVEQLREALTSRATIEQAKGLLMLRNRCSPKQAFEMLARISQERNVKLRDVAAELVDVATRPSAAAEPANGRENGRVNERR